MDHPRIRDEWRRLRTDATGRIATTTTSLVERFLALCPSGAVSVLRNAEAVLCSVDAAVLDGRLTTDCRFEGLPEWFVSACAPVMPSEQAERALAVLRALPREEQVRVATEQPWSLDNWLYWMLPENRCWYWLNGTPDTHDRHRLLVTVEIDGRPFAWEALRWLLRAAGAKTVECVEDR